MFSDFKTYFPYENMICFLVIYIYVYIFYYISFNLLRYICFSSLLHATDIFFYCYQLLLLQLISYLLIIFQDWFLYIFLIFIFLVYIFIYLFLIIEEGNFLIKPNFEERERVCVYTTYSKFKILYLHELFDNNKSE